MLAGAAAGLAIAGTTSPSTLILFGAAAAIPDLDLLFGSHRGPSHSVGAAAIAGVVGWLIWRPSSSRSRDRSRPGRLRFACALAVAYATHILLDWVSADTTPPIGLMALWPLTDDYHASPLRIFLPISRRYWLAESWLLNLRALTRELLILGPLLWIAAWVRGRR